MIRVSFIKHHEKQDCLFRDFKCTLECNSKVKFRGFASLERHLDKFCRNRDHEPTAKCVKRCSACDEDITNVICAYHERFTCKETQVKCKSCEQIVKRKHLLVHNSDECMERVVSCIHCSMQLKASFLCHHLYGFQGLETSTSLVTSLKTIFPSSRCTKIESKVTSRHLNQKVKILARKPNSLHFTDADWIQGRLRKITLTSITILLEEDCLIKTFNLMDVLVVKPIN